MELKKYNLHDVCEIIPGYAFKSNDFGQGDYIAIKITDIHPPTIELRNATNVCVKPKDARTQIHKGDFVMAMTGATIGKVGLMESEFDNVFINQRVCKFIPKEGFDKSYLYYVLLQQKFRKFIFANIDSSSAQPNIGHPTIYRFEHCFPDITIQRKAASVLSSLDSKISLNRKMNRTLEAMAKQLYDYWFVQFDYPDENGKPYKSSGGKMVWNEVLKREIPEGWEVKPLFESVSVQYGFPFSTESFTEEVTNIPVVRIRDILEGTISAYSYEDTDEKYHLQEGDVLVGMDGNFHMNYWHNNNAYLNQRCVRIRPYSNSPISSIQVLHSIKPFIKAKEQNAKGSTVGHLSDKDMKGLFLIEPRVSEMFNPRNAFDPLLKLMIKNKQEIASLTRQRDELLPLLMNGQVEVGE